jgi:signal transduction histidine kinase
MDTETLRKAIEPLFSTKGTVGVGMGLSLAQGVLLRQNGDLRLESVPGQGTTVTVHLPLPDVGCMII